MKSPQSTFQRHHAPRSEGGNAPPLFAFLCFSQQQVLPSRHHLVGIHTFSLLPSLPRCNSGLSVCVCVCVCVLSVPRWLCLFFRPSSCHHRCYGQPTENTSLTNMLAPGYWLQCLQRVMIETRPAKLLIYKHQYKPTHMHICIAFNVGR